MDNTTKFNWKTVGIAGSIILVIIVAFEVSLVKNSRKDLQSTPSNSSANSPAFATAEITDFNQKASLQYPVKYIKFDSKRPFDFNNEGRASSVTISCNSNCDGGKLQELELTVYENNQNWKVEDWMKKSAYKPVTDCAAAKVNNQKFKNYDAVTVQYSNVEGCAKKQIEAEMMPGNQAAPSNNINSSLRENTETYFEVNNKVYKVKTLSDVKDSQILVNMKNSIVIKN